MHSDLMFVPIKISGSFLLISVRKKLMKQQNISHRLLVFLFCTVKTLSVSAFTFVLAILYFLWQEFMLSFVIYWRREVECLRKGCCLQQEHWAILFWAGVAVYDQLPACVLASCSSIMAVSEWVGESHRPSVCLKNTTLDLWKGRCELEDLGHRTNGVLMP